MQTTLEVFQGLTSIQIIGLFVVVLLLIGLVLIINHAAQDFKNLPKYRRIGDDLGKDSAEVRTVEALLKTVLAHRDDQIQEAIDVLKSNHEMIKTNSEKIRKIEGLMATNLGPGLDEPEKK